jgi:hypothetical protein
MIKESFVLRVLAITFIFIALPLIVISFILFQNGYENGVSETKNELKNAAEERTFSLLHIRPVSPSLLGEIELFLDLGKTFPKTPSKEVSSQLVSIASKLPPGITMMLVGPERTTGLYPILESNEAEYLGQSIHSHDRLQSLDNATGIIEYIHAVYLEKEKRYTFYYYVAKEIKDNQNQSHLGYLLVGSNIDRDVEEVFRVAKRQYPQVEFALVVRQTVVVKATDPSIVGHYFVYLSAEEKNVYLRRVESSDATIIEPNPFQNTFKPGSPSFEFTKNNETQLAYLATSPQNIGLSFIAYVSKESLFNAAIRRFLIIYNAYGLIILLGGAATYYLSLYFARPLKNFSKLMEKVRMGDLSSRFKEQPWGFEINTLGVVFNHTLDALLTHMKKAEDYRVKKETRRKEIEIGYEVQRQLLPQQMPELKNIELATHYESSEVAGGDFHDVIVKTPQKIALIVADTATMGISACLYALGVRSLLRAYTMLYDDVAKIMQATNHMFCRDTLDSGMYVTLLYGLYDTESKILTYACCGRVPGIIRRKDGALVHLQTTAIAIGLSDGAKFESQKIELMAGDLLIFFSDGVIEARNENEEKFSIARLNQLIAKKQWTSPQELTSEIVKAVKEFSSEELREEDITLLAVRISDTP